MSERELFLAALQIADPHERSAWLDHACGGDAVLRQRIDELLQQGERITKGKLGNVGKVAAWALF